MQWPPRVEPLESERLEYFEITPAHVDDLFILGSRLEVVRTWGTTALKDRAEALALVERLQREFASQSMIRWGIREKSTQRLIGDVGFWRFVGVRSRAEIGAKLLPQFWSKGYITEAMRTVMDYGFRKMHLNGIEANMYTDHAASIRLVEKFNFTLVGRVPLHSYSAEADTFVDTLLYSLHRSQWETAIPWPSESLP